MGIVSIRHRRTTPEEADIAAWIEAQEVESVKYRETSLDDMRAVYRRIVRRKSNWLRGAMFCFGLGLAAFASLILIISLVRV